MKKNTKILTTIIIVICLLTYLVYIKYHEYESRLTLHNRINNQKRNVILVPGLAASSIYWRNKYSNEEFKKLWLTSNLLVPKGFGKTRLFRKRIAIQYFDNEFIEKLDTIETTTWRQNNYILDAETKEEKFVLTDDFGGLKGCTNLLNIMYCNIKRTKTFDDVATYFQSQDIEVYGTSFDFRKITGQSYWQYFSKMLTDLIIFSVKENHQKTNLVCHSLGGLLILIFAYQNPELIDMYVDKIITINSPFNGCFSAYDSLVYGNASGLSTDAQSVWFQELQIHYSGILFLVPFWENGKGFKINETTISNLGELFQFMKEKNIDINDNVLYENILPFRQLYLDARKFCSYFEDKLYHIFSLSENTIESIDYIHNYSVHNSFASKDSFARHVEKNKIEYEEGDSLVTSFSLQQGPMSTVKYMKKIGHTDILQDQHFIKYLFNFIF